MRTKTIEVDQSGRVEELAKDNAVGLANVEVSFAAILPKRVKRIVYERFRRTGRPKQFAPYVFAVAVSESLTLSEFQPLDLVIDIEYPGYEKEILEIVKCRHPEIEVHFTSIGKKSPAHFAAYGAYSGKRKPDYMFTTKRMMKLFERYNKNGPRTVTPRDKPDDSQPT